MVRRLEFFLTLFCMFAKVQSHSHWPTMLLVGSKVMVVRSFEVVAAYILQVTVFDVATHWTDLAGTACVISAVVMMGLEDIIMERLDWRFL